jgi:Icc protein
LPSVTIAHLTDCHILDPGKCLFGRVDTAARLAAVVAFLNALSPRPDAVVLTGDLVDGGRIEEYRHLQALLRPLAMPCHLVPGNHDDRDVLRQVFVDDPVLPASGFLQWAVDRDGIRLVGLDTLVSGQPAGNLCHERIAWLDRTLAERPGLPTLLFMHHPPFLTGIEAFDTIGCMGADRLAHILDRHPQVEAILCGHHHQPLVTRWNRVAAMVAPATAHQLVISAVGDAMPRWELSPPAFMLHSWRRGGGLMSRVAFADHFPGDAMPAGKRLSDAA